MQHKFLRYLFISGVIILFFHQSVAQCVPNNDPVIGIEPDTLAVAYVGIPYEQIIYFKMPLDTTVQFGTDTIPVVVDSLIITSYSGLPPSFSLACNTPTCTVLGGANGCAAITGTAILGDVGIHPLSVFVTTYISDIYGTQVGGFPDTIDFYFLDVRLSSDVQQLSNSGWMMGDIYPNPSEDKISVQIVSPVNDKVKLIVMDISGREMEVREVVMNRGSNTHWMDVSALQEGFYFIQLIHEEFSVNKKFQVKH